MRERERQRGESSRAAEEEEEDDDDDAMGNNNNNNGATTTAAPSTTTTTTRRRRFFDAIILGGGMSGLRCAKGILDDDDDDDADDDVNDDFFSVAVLEAKATIGGRVEQTEDVAPWPVELGAEFVHGEEANPIVRDVEDLGEEEEEEDSERLRFSRFDWPDRYAMMMTTTTTTTEQHHQQTPPPTPSLGRMDQLEIVDGDACEKNDADVWKIHRLFDRLPGVAKTSSSDDDDDKEDKDRMSSLSALEWLRDVQKCTEREIRLAELIYATDFGASLKDIGMREITIEKERWRNGEQYLVLNGGFNELFRRTFTRKFISESGTARKKTRGGSVEVRLNWEVKTVERMKDDDIEGGYVIKVTGTRDGKHQTLYGKKVVVSLPLPIYRPLEDDDDGCDDDDKKGKKKNKEALSRVAFRPPLSEEKRKALRAVKMGNAVKVLLGFSEKFWPQEDLFNVICDSPAPFPEFWVVSDKEKTIRCRDKKTKRRCFFGGKKKEDVRYVVTFFITGDRANAMAKIKPSERIEMAFKQFVGITLRTNDAKEFDRIRKTRLKTSATKVWAEDKFAGGSYTHPSVGCTAKTRSDLAKPEWSNTLFFCGEATNTSVNPCLQGAFETGARAAKEVLSSFKNRAQTTRAT